jgi:hypothetical protein
MRIIRAYEKDTEKTEAKKNARKTEKEKTRANGAEGE